MIVFQVGHAITEKTCCFTEVEPNEGLLLI